MMLKLRNLICSISILICYPLYSAGQMYLFISKQKETEFYDLINKYPGEWITAHIFLLASLILLIPAFIGLCRYFKDTRSSIYIQLSTFFTFLSVFQLFGQFTIDLCVVEIFKLPKELAYQTFDKVQNYPVINALFYNNSKLFFLFKYADLTLLGQLFLGVALLSCKKIPLWAKVLFVVALVGTQFGMLIGPYYGRIVKRLMYSLQSVSLLPIAVSILKWNSGKIKDETYPIQ